MPAPLVAATGRQVRRPHFCVLSLKQERLYQLHECVILRLALNVKANVELLELHAVRLHFASVQQPCRGSGRVEQKLRQLVRSLNPARRECKLSWWQRWQRSSCGTASSSLGEGLREGQPAMTTADTACRHLQHGRSWPHMRPSSNL